MHDKFDDRASPLIHSADLREAMGDAKGVLSDLIKANLLLCQVTETTLLGNLLSSQATVSGDCVR